MSSHHSHQHDHVHHDHDLAGHDHPHHDHGHHDHHEDKTAGRELSFEEKLIKIFDHWVKHNESHAQTYADWREKAKAQGMDGIAVLLEEIEQLSEQLTEKLKQGLSRAKTK